MAYEMIRSASNLKYQGQRVGNRLRLGLPATLKMTHDARSCVLENVSATGALVRIEAPLVKGQIAQLWFHELRLYGLVAWTRSDLCGLRFDTPVEREDMEGFLWITQNPEAYHQICRESGAHSWSRGD